MLRTISIVMVTVSEGSQLFSQFREMLPKQEHDHIVNSKGTGQTGERKRSSPLLQGRSARGPPHGTLTFMAITR